MTDTHENCVDTEVWRCIEEKRNDKFKSLLQKEVEKTCDCWNVLLQHATEWHNVEIVQHLIELGSDVDFVNEYGRTALTTAVQFLYSGILKLLLEAGANINIGDIDGKSILQYVLRPGYLHLKTIEMLLRHVKSKMSTTEELVDRLVENGCTFLNAALLKDAEVLDNIQRRGLDVNEADHHGITALYTAVQINDYEMTKLLIDFGADVNVNPRYLHKPLRIAAANMNPSIVEILLEHGAEYNPNVDSFDATPIWVLFVKGKDDLGEKIGECVEILLQYGAIPEDTRFSAKTIFNCSRSRPSSFGPFWIDLEINYLIAHFAMLQLKANGKPCVASIDCCKQVNDSSKIVQLEEDYKVYQQVLKQKVLRNLTLFDLLTASEYKMRVHRRNENFVSEVEKFSLTHDLQKLCPYYYNTLMRRTFKAERMIKLEDKAILIICKIFATSRNQCYVAAREILSYLREHELERFSQL